MGLLTSSIVARFLASLTLSTLTHRGPSAALLHPSGYEPGGAITSVTPWAARRRAPTEERVCASWLDLSLRSLLSSRGSDEVGLWVAMV